MKRMLLAAALSVGVIGPTAVHAADETVPTVLTAHDVVMRFDGLNGAYYFGDLKTVIVNGWSGDGVGGLTVKFFQGDQQICEAVSDSRGVAICADPAAELAAIQSRGYVARFDGDATYGSSEDDAVLITAAGQRI